MGGCFSKNIEEKFHKYTDEYIVVTTPEYNFQRVASKLALNLTIHHRLTSLTNLKQALSKQYTKKRAKIIRIRNEIKILRAIQI